MSAIFGSRFTDMWKNTDVNEMKLVWADALGGFDSDAIAGALRQCLEEKYPPNLPEFVTMCRRKLITKRPVLALSDSLPDEVCRQRIKELKERIGK